MTTCSECGRNQNLGGRWITTKVLSSTRSGGWSFGAYSSTIQKRRGGNSARYHTGSVTHRMQRLFQCQTCWEEKKRWFWIKMKFGCIAVLAIVIYLALTTLYDYISIHFPLDIWAELEYTLLQLVPEGAHIVSIENTILSHVLYDDDFARKVIPFLKDEYFQEAGDKLVFSEINKFMISYNSLPTRRSDIGLYHRSD